MFLKVCCFLVLSVGCYQARAVTCAKLLTPEIDVKRITSRNFIKSVQYLDHNGLRVPYVDLLPSSTPNGKTVFLASGFSKNMRSWLPHMRILRRLGYRVLAFDQTNVGYNLSENGITNLERGTGLDFDADLAMAVLGKSGVDKSLLVIGHSRGAAVAARLTDQALSLGIDVERLILLTPYVRYIWDSKNISDSVNEAFYDAFSDVYPYYFGQLLYDASNKKKYEEIEGLSSFTESAALVSILKGVKLNDRSEVKTKDILNSIQEQDSSIKIQAFAAEHDTKFAPAAIVQELEGGGVEFSVLKGKKADHYWPLHYAESMLKRLGFLE